MPFWRLYYHLVWPTRNREPLIQPAIEGQLYALLKQKAGELSVWIYEVNSWYDHVHMVVAIPPKHAVADVVKHFKGESAHAINHAGLDISFGWQRGYGALSIGERHRPVAEAYVRNQKQHHQDGQVICVLEHCNEVEEGPNDRSLPPGEALREIEVSYDVGGDAFWLDDDWPELMERGPEAQGQ
jgi:putative transposase